MRKNAIVAAVVVAVIVIIGLLVFFLGDTILANARQHLSGLGL